MLVMANPMNSAVMINKGIANGNILKEFVENYQHRSGLILPHDFNLQLVGTLETILNCPHLTIIPIKSAFGDIKAYRCKSCGVSGSKQIFDDLFSGKIQIKKGY